MTDYIRRGDGIEFIESLVSTRSVCVSADECAGMKSMQKRAIGALRDVPAADVVEVVHGEWIEDGYNHYKAVCSECGEPCGTYVMNNPRDRFCKWCGAKMDGGADG